MCRECHAASRRQDAAQQLLDQARSMNPLGAAIHAAFPTPRQRNADLDRLTAQIERLALP